MVAQNILVSFLEYNHRANGHVLAKVKQLTKVQLRAAVNISRGNAFELIRTHHRSELSRFLDDNGGYGGSGGCPKTSAIQKTSQNEGEWRIWRIWRIWRLNQSLTR